MGSSYELPNSKGIADLFEMIFGENIGVNEGTVGDLANDHVATFLNPDDSPVAICACDASFVTYAGAALSMIPPDVANEMISDGELTDVITANFYEVMNICSKLMMSETSAHLRLDKVLPPGQSADPLAALAENGTSQRFDVDIPNYGRGALSFLISQQ